MAKPQSAFTLVELLVTIAIIAGLAAAGLAGTSQIIEKTKSTKSLSNLKQIGLAALTYAADNSGQLPQSSHQKTLPGQSTRRWTKVLPEYGISSAMFVSPLDTAKRTLSYAINDFVTEHPYGAEELDFSRVQTISYPSSTIYLSILNSQQLNSDHFHFAEAGFAPASFEQEVWVDIVDGAGHYLFVDGHVEVLRWDAVKTLLTASGSTFVRPDGKN